MLLSESKQAGMLPISSNMSFKIARMDSPRNSLVNLVVERHLVLLRDDPCLDDGFGDLLSAVLFRDSRRPFHSQQNRSLFFVAFEPMEDYCIKSRIFGPRDSFRR